MACDQQADEHYGNDEAHHLRAFDCLAVTRSAFMGTSPRNRPQGVQMTANIALRVIDNVVASMMFL